MAFKGQTPYKSPGGGGCPSLKWSQDLGFGPKNWWFSESSPAVDPEGRAFVGSSGSRSGVGQMYALSIENGTVLWTFSPSGGPTLSTEFFASPAIYVDPRGEAAAHPTLVLAGAGSGTFFALDAADGAVVWSFRTGNVTVGARGGTGNAPITSSAVLKHGVGYVGGWDGVVYAFNPATGEIHWKFQAIDEDTNTSAQIRATPALSHDGATLHFPAGRAMYAVDAASGKLRWLVQTKQVIYSSPTINKDGVVFYGASGGGVANAVSPEGAVLWTSNLTEFASTMAAIASDGGVLMSSGGANLIKLDPTSGKALWTSNRGMEPVSAMTQDAAGNVWLPSHGGLVFASPDGNITQCVPQSALAGMCQVILATDGVLLAMTEHGGVMAFA